MNTLTTPRGIVLIMALTVHRLLAFSRKVSFGEEPKVEKPSSLSYPIH